MAYGNLMPYISTGFFACQYGLLNIGMTLHFEGRMMDTVANMHLVPFQYSVAYGEDTDKEGGMRKLLCQP